MAITIRGAVRKARTRTNLWSGRKYIESPRTNTMVKSNRANQQMNQRQIAAREARREAVRKAYKANIREGASVKALAQSQERQPMRTATTWDETRKKYRANR